MGDIEQRATERVRTLMLGTVTIDTRTITCVIADFSANGARLRISPNVLLPDSFELYAPQHWATYLVALRWRDGEDVGVEFMQSNRLAPAAAC
jgi:hypothetical protein